MTLDQLKYIIEIAETGSVTAAAERLESEYKSAPPPRRVFSVSSQHYAFVVNAFVELVREYGRDKYEFTLRELKTAEIIEDVRTHRSDIGILYLSRFNREVVIMHPMFLQSLLRSLAIKAKEPNFKNSAKWGYFSLLH